VKQFSRLPFAIDPRFTLPEDQDRPPVIAGNLAVAGKWNAALSDCCKTEV
jgi:hypothetical protein